MYVEIQINRYIYIYVLILLTYDDDSIFRGFSECIGQRKYW
jgi:hypothetical protein